MEQAPKQRRGERVKRAVDILAALPLLALSLLLLPFLALVIRLESRGPIFYRQERLGRGGRPFFLWKFRTMRPDAEHLPSPQRKGPDDPRVTRVGRWLRRSSLDELPQAWNILRGEMSLVGPRPLNAKETDRLGPRAWERLAVCPGLTGLWQVSGRSDVPAQDWLAFDLLYIERRSTALDLWILLRTIPAVLTGRGAY